MGSVTTVSSTDCDSAGATTIAAVNAARVGLFIYADGDALYVKLGTGATTTDFTVKIDPGGYWECPERGIHVGAVSAICASGQTCTARVTEVRW